MRVSETPASGGHPALSGHSQELQRDLVTPESYMANEVFEFSSTGVNSGNLVSGMLSHGDNQPEDDWTLVDSEAPRPGSEAMSTINVTALCAALRDHEQTVLPENAESVLVVGKTGVGKSTFINYMIGKRFVWSTHEDDCDLGHIGSAEQDDWLVDDTDFIQLLTCQDAGGPVIGAGSSSVTHNVSGFRHSEHPTLLYCDTPGFSDTGGVQADTFQSMLITHSVRQTKNVRIVYIAKMKFMQKDHLGDRTNHTDMYNQFKQIVQLLKEDRSHFTSVTILFSVPADGKTAQEEISGAYKGLYAFRQHAEFFQKTTAQGELNPNFDPDTAALTDHFMNTIKSAGKDNASLLVIRPADPEELQPMTDSWLDATARADFIRTIIEMSIPLLPECVGASLAPGAVRCLEAACLEYCRSIQEALRDGAGVCEQMVFRNLADLRLLRDHSDVFAVKENYDKAVASTETFISSRFCDAIRALENQEYQSAAENLKKVGSLQHLKRLSKEHADGILKPIHKHWSGFSKQTNKMAEELTGLICATADSSHSQSYSSLVQPLANLRSISELLKAYLVDKNKTCFTNTIELLRQRLHREHKDALDLIKSEIFNEKLKNLTEQIEGSQVLSPSFLDHGNRLQEVEQHLSETANKIAARFCEHSKSIRSLIEGDEIVSIALQKITNLQTFMERYLSTHTYTKCLLRFDALHNEATQAFDCELRRALHHRAENIESDLTFDTADWLSVVKSYRRLHDVSRIRRDDTATKVSWEKSKERLAQELQDLSLVTLDAQDSKLDVPALAPLLIGFQDAHKALSTETICRSEANKTAATLGTLVLSVNNDIAKLLDKANNVMDADCALTENDCLVLRQSLSIAEKFAAFHLFEFASQQSQVQIENKQLSLNVELMRSKLFEKLKSRVEETCKQSDIHAISLKSASILSEGQISQLVLQIEQLDLQTGLLQYLRTAAPVTEAVIFAKHNELIESDKSSHIADTVTGSTSTKLTVQLPRHLLGHPRNDAVNDAKQGNTTLLDGNRTQSGSFTLKSSPNSAMMPSDSNWPIMSSMLAMLQDKNTVQPENIVGGIGTSDALLGSETTISEDVESEQHIDVHATKNIDYAKSDCNSKLSSFAEIVSIIVQSRKTLCTSLQSYGNRCLSRCQESLKKNALEDVEKTLVALQGAAEAFDEYLDDTSLISIKLESAEHSIRSKFNTFAKDVFEAINNDQLTHAQELIHLLRSFLLFEYLFKEFSPSEIVQRATQEYTKKTSDFYGRAWHLYNNQKYFEVAELVRGSEGNRDENGTECAIFKKAVMEQIRPFVQRCFWILDQSRFRHDQTLHQEFHYVANVSDVLHRLEPLGATIGEQFGNAVQGLDKRINDYVDLLARNGRIEANRGNFVYASNARQSLEQVMNLCVSSDNVKESLEWLDNELRITVQCLPDQLNNILNGTHPSPETIDCFFEGLTAARNTSPCTHILREVNLMTDRLRSCLEDFLRTLKNNIKDAYLNYDLTTAESSWIKLQGLMVAHISQSVAYDIDVRELREYRDVTINEMFRVQFICGIDVDDRRRKIDGLKQVCPLQYKSMLSSFLENNVNSLATGVEVDCQSSGNDIKLLRTISQLLERFPRYADVFPDNCTEVMLSLKKVDQGLVDKIQSVLRDAQVRMRDRDIGNVIHDHAMFLEKAVQQDVLPRAKATETWRHEYCSSQPDNLIQNVKEFLDRTINQDAGEIERGWQDLIESLQLGQEPNPEPSELVSFVKKLNKEQAIIRQLPNIREDISYDSAIHKIEKAAGNKAVQAAVYKAVDTGDFKCISRIADTVRRLQRVDSQIPQLSHMFEASAEEFTKVINSLLSQYDEEASCNYEKAMGCNGAARDKYIAIVNEKIEMVEILESVSKQDKPSRVASTSAAVQSIKGVCSKAAQSTVQEIKRCNPKTPGICNMVAEGLVRIYETPAGLSSEEIKAHAHFCNSDILNAFKKMCDRGGASVAALEEALGRYELGHELVDTYSIFTRERSLKLQKAMSVLAPEAAINRLVADNGLDKLQRNRLELYWKRYDDIFQSEVIKHYANPEKIASAAKWSYTTSRKRPSEKLVELIAKIAVVWSLKKSPHDERGTISIYLKPHSAQILAIFRLLQLDCADESGLFEMLGRRVLGSKMDKAKLDSHLTQIKTGQGKSVVLGICSTVLAVMGMKVDCACYSRYLSVRDQEDFQDIFHLFEVSDQVKYGTFQDLASKLINESGNVRTLTTGLCVNKKAGRDCMSVKTRQRRDRVLLIDEVDMFFSKEFYGNTYNPTASITGPDVSALLRCAWENRTKPSSELRDILLKHESYELLLNRVGKSGLRQSIIKDQIYKCIRDLKDFLGDRQPAEKPELQYKVVDGKVSYRTLDTVSADVLYGYRTLWTYFYEQQQGTVTAEVMESYLSLSISCGQFSYAEVPKEYCVILGVTGTLRQTLDLPFEKKVLEDVYGIKHHTIMPSMFGDSKLDFKERDSVFIEANLDEYYRKIREEVQQNVDRGRPVLVFFESESELRAWGNSSYGTSSFPTGQVASITAATPNIDHYIQRASRAKIVTLLAREHGRGLDFKGTSDKVDAAKGIHIVHTFLSEDPSEEVQIQGRTARMGKNGTYCLVLLSQTLVKFGVTSDEIDDIQKGGTKTMYDLLCCKRRSFLEKNSVTRQAAAEVALGAHKASKEFQKSLVQAVHVPSGTKGLPGKRPKAEAVDMALRYILAQNAPARSCRLICLSDATGSMDALWDATRDQFGEMLKRIADISGGSDNVDVQWVAYRDYDCCHNDSCPLLQSSGWTSDAAGLVRFLGSIVCNGGGDGPEAVEKALEFVNKLDEAPSRVLLFADAPPHNEKKGQMLVYHNHKMDTDYSRECEKLAEKNVPVFPFYMHTAAKASFEEIARITGGEAKSLDRARIEKGDANQLLDAVCMQALSEIGGKEMETQYCARYR